MLSRRLALAKIEHGEHPLRLFKITYDLSKPRPFTQNSQLLLVSHQASRPQLPFLHHATGGNLLPIVPRTRLQYQLARLLTTERKIYLKDQIRKGAKWTLYSWTALFLFTVMAWGLQFEIADRRFPAPPEWTWKSRNVYYLTKSRELTDPSGTGIIDWSKIGFSYIRLIGRLEDPAIDGQDVRPVLYEDGDLYVDGVGKTGLDISAKSTAWRQGYYEALMGAAKAAENREGWVIDRKTRAAFPPGFVVGPSNPRPKRIPYGATANPLEEDCYPAFPAVETFYMKVLTTIGFNSRQRLETALAYAGWLDFKALSSTAEEMYDWGLDIAMGALPVGVNNVVDMKTGVIDKNTTYTSSNILRATTALAEHHARNNNLAAALPIFISVLRARRQLPAPPLETPPTAGRLSTLSIIRSFIAGPPFPPEPPTGDEIPSRTPAAICEEAGIMSHIGEIFFVTGDRLENKQSGMSWTRDAVDLAEETVNSVTNDDQNFKRRCTECLAIGMDNWDKMIQKMRQDERQGKFGTQKKSGGNWFWGQSAANDTAEEGKWEREAKNVDERLRSVRRLVAMEEDRQQAQYPHLFAWPTR